MRVLAYRIVGGVRFYERREIRDVLAYLQLAVNPADEAAFLAPWAGRAGAWAASRWSGCSPRRREGETLMAAAERASATSDAVPTAGARALEDFAAASSRSTCCPGGHGREVRRDRVQRVRVPCGARGEDDGEDRLANLTSSSRRSRSSTRRSVDERPEGRASWSCT